MDYSPSQQIHGQNFRTILPNENEPFSSFLFASSLGGTAFELYLRKYWKIYDNNFFIFLTLTTIALLIS